jgi:YesN/AraC family two-component response regulator
MCGMFIDAERQYSSIEKIKETAKKFSLNETTLLNLYNKLPVLSKSTVESALNILNICIQHILREHFLEVRSNELSTQIREYILENLSENLTADHLCNVFFTNKQKLHSIFKEHFNDSIHNYIIKKRIEKAKTLLSQTTKTIDTIAFETGFPNYNYFIKIFKKRTGFSPLQFRKHFPKQ